MVFHWRSVGQLPGSELTPAPAFSLPVVEVVPAPPVASQPFRWSQLESTNYLVYIANLRNIGCPQQTIRDIITADLDSVYAAQQKELESASATSAGTGADGNSDTGAAISPQLRSQKNAVLASLLGTSASAAPDASISSVSDQVASAPPPVPHRTRRPPPPDNRVFIPAAMQEVDQSALNLTADEQQAVAEVQQNFVSDVGGTGQNPNDPAYLQKWQNSQAVADGMLRARLGQARYMEYLQAMSAPQASSGY